MNGVSNMKKRLFVFCFTAIVALSILGCGTSYSENYSGKSNDSESSSEEPTIFNYDNTNTFSRIEKRYNALKNSQNEYGEFVDISNTNYPVSFSIFEMPTYENIYEETEDNYHAEFPFLDLNMRKYAFVPSVVLDPSDAAIFYSSYTSDSFADMFDRYLEKATFKKNEDEKSALALIMSKNHRYLIYVDGTVGLQYTDGYHLCDDKIELFTVFKEYINCRTFSLDIETLIDELRGRVNQGYTVSYNGKEVVIDDFSDYLINAKKDNTYASYLVNTKQFDFSKLLKIEYSYENGGTIKETTRYLTKTGILVNESSSFITFGGYCYALSSETGHLYHCYHIRMDMNKLLSLFE